MAKPPPIPTLKRPSAGVPLDAMAAFVGGSDAPAQAEAPPASPALSLAPAPPEAPAVAPSPEAEAPSPEARPRGGKKSRRRVEARADGSQVRKITVYLAEDLDRALTLYAATNETEKSEVVSELLARFLRSKKADAPQGS